MHDGRVSRLDHGDFISPQTIAVCDGAPYVFVPDYVRGLAAFDLETGAVVRWLGSADLHALDGIDGLYCRGHTMVAVQNGVKPERVVSFVLDPIFKTIVGEHVLERRVDGGFTHAVLAGNALLFLADAGWSALDEHGQQQVGAALAAPRIMRADHVMEQPTTVDRPGA